MSHPIATSSDPRAIAVRISAITIDDRVHISLSGLDPKTQRMVPDEPIEAKIEKQMLIGLRTRFHDALTRFKTSIREVTEDENAELKPSSGRADPRIGIAVETLRCEMNSVLKHCLGSIKVLHDVQSLFSTCCPHWNRRANGHVIEVCADLHTMLPVEALPLFPAPPDDIRAFPAFGSIIARTLIPLILSDSESSCINNEGGLPVKFLRHAGLKGAQKEARWFRSFRKHNAVQFHRPFPQRARYSYKRFNQHDGKGFRENVFFTKRAGRYIYHPSNALLDENLTDPDLPPAEILHCACHCDSTANEEAIYLYGGRDPSDGLKVRLSILDGYFCTLEKDPLWREPASRPLVFLNACGASKLRADSPASFPELFLGMKGNKGFIGPETDVPDAFAAEFAKWFYVYLLQLEPIGMAIRNARWEMFTRYGNPLGIVYTAYANPMLRVQKNANLPIP